MKKFRILCAAALICLVPGAALANDDVMLISEGFSNEAAVESAASVVLSGFGEVEEIGEDYVTVKLAEGSVVARVQLNVTEESVILDNVTGEAVKLADIKQGESVFAYFDDKLTKSIPAQAALSALFTNVEESTPGLLWTVEEVAHSNSDSKILTVDNGGLEITVNTNEEIKQGDRVVAWYDLVMPSLPAQATADRVVVLASVDTAVPEEEVPAVEIATLPSGVSVNGEALDVELELVNEQVCVPLRAISEALGFELTWNPNEMSAHITNGTVQTKVAMGDKTFYRETAIEGMMGLTGPQDLGAEAYLRNKEVMYVPVNLFKLLGFDVQIGELVSISAAQ